MAATRRRNKKPDASGALIVQPTTRTQTQWTPSQIRAAEVQAQTGDLRIAGQLCEWILGDEQIARALHTRAQALLGLEPTFEKTGDKRRSSRVVKALEVGEDWWDGWPESQLVELVIWGILLGCGFARQPWAVAPGHSGRMLPFPQVWEAQHIRHDFHKRVWVARVATEGQLGAGVDEEFQPGDGTWIVHAPYGAARPWMRGLWRGLARWRLLRDYAVSDLGRLGEGASRNVVESEKEVEQTHEKRKELAADLSNMGRDSTIVLPSGFTYKLVTTSAGTAEIYQKQVDLAERAIAIAIRGGNLTTNTQGGSRAAAEVQERLGDDANLRFDAQSLATTIHDQSLSWWAEFNFGNPELAPWPVWPVEPEEDVKEKVEGEFKSFETVDKAESLGFEVDRQKFLEEHRILWAKPGKRPEPEPPSGGNAPAPGADETSADHDDQESGDGEPKAEPKVTGLAQLLVSGAAISDNRGFLDGHNYAGTAHDWAVKRGVETIHTDLEHIAQIVDASTSYEDLRARLEEFMGEDFDPDELAELTARAMMLAELAGRLAVRKDVPELES